MYSELNVFRDVMLHLAPVSSLNVTFLVYFQALCPDFLIIFIACLNALSIFHFRCSNKHVSATLILFNCIHIFFLALCVAHFCSDFSFGKTCMSAHMLDTFLLHECCHICCKLHFLHWLSLSIFVLNLSFVLVFTVWILCTSTSSFNAFTWLDVISLARQLSIAFVLVLELPLSKVSLLLDHCWCHIPFCHVPVSRADL